MFKIDNEFLKEIGKDDMPQAEKSAFLEHLQEELEVRIGERVIDGLTDEQIDEFEKITNGDIDTIQRFIQTFPNYQDNSTYKKLLAVNHGADTPNLLKEFVGIKWLESNRPDYQDIVVKITNELKSEITASKDAI
jgi:hypothetical protein